MTPQPSSADETRTPVIAVHDHGLTLGVDSDGTWILWNDSNAVQMNLFEPPRAHPLHGRTVGDDVNDLLG